MSITKIVITGGPCAGKTTALRRISDTFGAMGYTVLTVPETATELIGGGVAPWTCKTNAEFQKYLIGFQQRKESIFESAAAGMPCEKILIVCDRGAMDNKAYMTDTEFAEVLRDLGTKEVELRDGYEAVFHLVTAANGAEEFYTVENNQARIEDAEKARELDDRTMSAWVGHPHLRIIDNSTDFEGKLDRLIREIAFFLGEPEPLEIERKFLIEYPDLRLLESLPNCRKVSIVQTYLTTPEGERARIRQRGDGDSSVYFLTQKKSVSDVKRIEIERRLTREEYDALMRDGSDMSRVEKDRYCYAYDGQYFEIDVYPFWDDRAILELELCDESTDIRFPPEIKVVREVTDDKLYNNSSLAMPV